MADTPPKQAKICIDTAQPDDALQIAEVQIAAWRFSYRDIIPAAYLDELNTEARREVWAGVCGREKSHLLVARQDGAVLGFCHLCATRDADGTKEDVAELTSMYLSPSHYRQGLGRALMHATLKLAAAGGWQQVTLWVLQENKVAKSFYEALGFQKDGTVKRESIGGKMLMEERYGIPLLE